MKKSLIDLNNDQLKVLKKFKGSFYEGVVVVIIAAIKVNLFNNLKIPKDLSYQYHGVHSYWLYVYNYIYSVVLSLEQKNNLILEAQNITEKDFCDFMELCNKIAEKNKVMDVFTELDNQVAKAIINTVISLQMSSKCNVCINDNGFKIVSLEDSKEVFLDGEYSNIKTGFVVGDLKINSDGKHIMHRFTIFDDDWFLLKNKIEVR